MAALLWTFILAYFGNTICVNNASTSQVNVTHVVSKDTFVFDKAFNLTGRQENASAQPQLLTSTEQRANVSVRADGGVRAETSTFRAEFTTTETPTFTPADLQTTETPLFTTEGTKTLVTATLTTGGEGISSLPLPLSGSLPQPVTEGITLKGQLFVCLFVSNLYKSPGEHGEHDLNCWFKPGNQQLTLQKSSVQDTGCLMAGLALQMNLLTIPIKIKIKIPS